MLFLRDEHPLWHSNNVFCEQSFEIVFVQTLETGHNIVTRRSNHRRPMRQDKPQAAPRLQRLCLWTKYFAAHYFFLVC